MKYKFFRSWQTENVVRSFTAPSHGAVKPDTATGICAQSSFFPSTEIDYTDGALIRGVSNMLCPGA